MKKLVLGLLSLTLIAAVSCKKSKDAPAITKENIAGTYKVMSIKASVNGSAMQDADTRDACQKDDLIELKTDDSYNYHDAGTACDPAGDFTGTWTLTDKDITTDDGSMYGTITSFDGSNMEVTVNTSEGGMTIKIVTQFKKQ